ncbi:MAG: helix-turn-helix transcriptional regulator [Ruminococcaceae bacterium]|nr:helix-turn-helix transcriptional regulator [Oscillospiraceae bacterium]
MDDNKNFHIDELTVKLINVLLCVPPMKWVGDCIGHMGSHDDFFLVLEGECYLNIDSESYIVRPGQLAFLPKGKMRQYTTASDNFCMYELIFSATSHDMNLMEIMGLTKGDYVVDIKDKEHMSKLFESCHRISMKRSQIHDIGSCANIINIIKAYASSREETKVSHTAEFNAVIDYMRKNLKKKIDINELSAIMYMQPTYFIRKFKSAFGMPPLKYLWKLRLFKAMNLLSSTDMPISEVASQTGTDDIYYFTKAFKKANGITPAEYRKAFRQV